MPFRDQDPLERTPAINRFQRIDPQVTPFSQPAVVSDPGEV
jgi:hypothetical protein